MRGRIWHDLPDPVCLGPAVQGPGALLDPDRQEQVARTKSPEARRPCFG